MKCPKCDVDMVKGKAIKSNEETNCRYLVPIQLINADTLEIISVLKCPKCGYSDDNMENDNEPKD